MTRHLKVDKPDHDNRLDHMVQGVLGQPLNRLEGPLKVTGRAAYAAEVRPDKIAYGVLVQASIPAGRVLDIGDAPGALAVIHDPRMIRYASQGMDQKGPKAGPDQVEYMGQAIALVVADSFEAATNAAQNLSVRYSAETAVVDPNAVKPELPPKNNRTPAIWLRPCGMPPFPWTRCGTPRPRWPPRWSHMPPSPNGTAIT